MLLICPVLSPITWNCRIFSFNFILRSGLSYFRILTICLLLVYFVSAAGCHLYGVGRCFSLCGCDMMSGLPLRIYPYNFVSCVSPKILRTLSTEPLFSLFFAWLFFQGIFGCYVTYFSVVKFHSFLFDIFVSLFSSLVLLKLSRLLQFESLFSFFFFPACTVFM